MCIFAMFFFFKQKTAYEMRISDWSSDVCSSDLGAAEQERPEEGMADEPQPQSQAAGDGARGIQRAGRLRRADAHGACPQHGRLMSGQLPSARRSEEHTSELQSLMRISYAVFCLKKKKKQNSREQRRDNYTIHNYKN